MNLKASYIKVPRVQSMNRDDEMVRHEFASGDEPTIRSADICAEVGHDNCKGMEATIEEYEGKMVFCICWCHRFVALEPN